MAPNEQVVGSNPTSGSNSNLDDAKRRVEKVGIIGVGRHDGLACPSGADDHVGISDIGCPARRQEPAHVRRVDAVKGDDIGGGLANKWARRPDAQDDASLGQAP